MWFLFAVLAPALYGVTNFIDKYLVEKKVKDPLLLTVVGGFIFSSIGFVIFLFHGAPLLPFHQIIFLLVGGTLLSLYLVPYYHALKREDASMVVPLFQFIPPFVILLSYLFLGEALSLKQGLGSLSILVGSFLLSSDHINGKLFRPRKTFWLMLFASFLVAVVFTLFRSVVRVHDFWIVLSYQLMGGSIGSILLLFFFVGHTRIPEALSQVKKIWPFFLANEGISLIAEICEMYAVSLAPVGLVSIAGGAQSVFVLGYGLFLSMLFPHIITEDIKKETIGMKLFTILCIFVGLILIYT